jgi:hypothetical protein
LGAKRIERFFQFSLLGVVASGYFALVDTGYLDRPALVLTFLGLLVRALAISGVIRLPLTPRHASLAAVAYLAFLPIDYYLISRDFLTATVHGVCFLAVAKILTARTARDYAFTGVISFIELVAAALLSSQASFFGWLVLYTAFAIAAFASGEIYRSLLTDCANDRAFVAEYSAADQFLQRSKPGWVREHCPGQPHRDAHSKLFAQISGRREMAWRGAEPL